MRATGLIVLGSPGITSALRVQVSRAIGSNSTDLPRLFEALVSFLLGFENHLIIFLNIANTWRQPQNPMYISRCPLAENINHPHHVTGFGDLDAVEFQEKMFRGVNSSLVHPGCSGPTHEDRLTVMQTRDASCRLTATLSAGRSSQLPP